jgi:hypothetical protein
VEIGDFIHPSGELLPALFPNENLTNLVTTWLAEAATKVATFPAGSVDAATAAWVYYRAFSAVANRLAATPTREAYFNDVDRWVSADRVEFFRGQAQQHLQTFQALTSAAASSSATVLQRPPMTGSSAVRATW